MKDGGGCCNFMLFVFSASAFCIGFLTGIGFAPRIYEESSVINWAAVGSIATAIAVFIAAFALIVQFRLSEKQNEIQLTISILKEWRSEKMRKERELLYKELSNIDETKELNDLKPAVREAFKNVASFCDTIGLLTARKNFREELISSYIGVSLKRLGKYLMPYIRRERERRAKENDSPIYFNYFENHLVQLNEKSPEFFIRDLKKLEDDALK